jgi:hypothetical protein
MKKHLLLLLLFVPGFIFAQAPKYNKLDAKNPLVGTWQWEKDPTATPFQPVPETDFIYIRFSAGDSLSVGAISNDENKGMLGTCYFLAYSNGGTIFGTLNNCSNPANNGKTFRMSYAVQGDELVITVKGEEIIYRRM